MGGRYRIIEPIDEGSMGDVYRAVHVVTGQKVTLKILKVQAVATIDHPGVVTVYDAGVHENTLYIAMELLVGDDQGARHRRRDP